MTPVPFKAIFTTSAYVLGRELGMEAGLHEFNRQLEEPTHDSLPVVRNIHRVKMLGGEVAIHVDTGSSSVARNRCRAFHAAYELGWPIWIACDDDVESTQQTFGHLIDAVDDPRPRIVIAPCLLRAPDSMQAIANVEFGAIAIERELVPTRTVIQATLRQCKGGGFGLVAMNRAAMIEIVEAQEKPRQTIGVSLHTDGMYVADTDIRAPWYVDNDAVKRRALFHELILAGRWWGEDRSFFLRVPESVTIEALLTGATNHNGAALDLQVLR